MKMEKDDAVRKKVLTFGNTKSIMRIGYEGGVRMARMGRPMVDNPINHVVTVKFREEEYQLMLEYAKAHDLSISQMIRLGIELQLKDQSPKE